MTKIETLLQEYSSCKPLHRSYQFYCVDIDEIADHGKREMFESLNIALNVGFAMGRRFEKNQAAKRKREKTKGGMT